MSSDVDICNLALARLGDDATVSSISPPEGSAQAEHCARFFPVARDSLLELHAWNFATRRVNLALLSVTRGAWLYAYAKPTRALNLLAVLDPDAPDDFTASGYAPQPFTVETLDDGQEVLLTNQPNATLRYTVKIEDASAFSPLFTDCLAWYLASLLAGPLYKGETGVKLGLACKKEFAGLLARATASNANAAEERPSHIVAWIAQRA